MSEVVRQLSGIGGGRSLGFGPNRVRSLPDGVGKILDEYLSGQLNHQINNENISESTEVAPQNKKEEFVPDLLTVAMHDRLQPETGVNRPVVKMGDLCPECGEAAMVNEEGCRKCYSCGYSEC